MTKQVFTSSTKITKAINADQEAWRWRFSPWCTWGFKCFGLWRCITEWAITITLKNQSASTFKDHALCRAQLAYSWHWTCRRHTVQSQYWAPLTIWQSITSPKTWILGKVIMSSDGNYTLGQWDTAVHTCLTDRCLKRLSHTQTLQQCWWTVISHKIDKLHFLCLMQMAPAHMYTSVPSANGTGQHVYICAWCKWHWPTCIQGVSRL